MTAFRILSPPPVTVFLRARSSHVMVDQAVGGQPETLLQTCILCDAARLGYAAVCDVTAPVSLKVPHCWLHRQGSKERGVGWCVRMEGGECEGAWLEGRVANRGGGEGREKDREIEK